MHSESELRELIASCCGVSVEECLDDVSLFILGIDSLALASMIARCETELRVDLDGDSIQAIMSAQSVRDVIAHLQAAQLKSGTKA